MKHGLFIISLDFELYWGVRGNASFSDVKASLKGVHTAIPKILELFEKYQIHATWAAVGFLFAKNLCELKNFFPNKFPDYIDKKLCPYLYIDGNKELEALYHFAPSLIELIQSYDGQEIATHTFSHYYCLEPHQSVEAFKEDILSAICISKKKNIIFKSIIFPRNQVSDDYLNILKSLGFLCYRGNEQNWLNTPKASEDKMLFRRLLRLLDQYINITGSNTYALPFLRKGIYNLPASRFLRSYNRRFLYAEYFRLRRIKQSMTYAAKNKQIFHLWWHPHNFGLNTDDNICFLKKIFEHYKYLNKLYKFSSVNMREVFC